MKAPCKAHYVKNDFSKQIIQKIGTGVSPFCWDEKKTILCTAYQLSIVFNIIIMEPFHKIEGNGNIEPRIVALKRRKMKKSSISTWSVRFSI